MRLKTLEVAGFKSFVDRTTVHFEEGVTGIVGPNGCGKSNVVDAIRWVMGEQSAKHLRGGQMEDVIFNGSESRQSMGMAQAFLTFDNEDGRAPAEYAEYSEIQVGRRLYRSGESEYFINKTPCRLKDIIDLFLGTGVGTKAYSIVEQGMIGSIVSSKPEDRRLLIEEAAGISKFKSRKEAALRRMEATKVNLARLSDIIAELSRQINSLNRQAKKAERYQQLSAELRERELCVASTHYRRLSQGLQDCEAENQRLMEVEASSLAALASREAEVEARKLSVATVERELDCAQQELYGVRNSLKLGEALIQHKEKEVLSTEQRNKTATAEVENLRLRIATLAEKLSALNSSKVEADLQLAGSSEAMGLLETEVMELKARRTEMVAELEKQRSAVHAFAAILSETQANIDNLERRHIDIEERMVKDQAALDTTLRQRGGVTQEIVKLEAELSRLKQLRFTLTEETGSLRATLDDQRRAFSDAEHHLQELQSRVQERQSRLDSLTALAKNLEGYRDGVRTILTRSRDGDDVLGGIVGTVGELIDTESQYEDAVAAVLGDKLQHVIVLSHAQGVTAVDYLRQMSSGRGTFLPLDVRIKGEDRAYPKGPGIIGELINYIRLKDGHERIGQYLFGDVVLVENLGRALELWREADRGFTYVTPAGEVVDPAGCVSGGSGSDSAHQLIAQKRKIEELTGEVGLLRQELAAAVGETTNLRHRVKSIEESLEGRTRDAHSEELKMVNFNRDIEHFRAELVRYEQEKDKIGVEIKMLHKEQEEIHIERAKATARHQQAQIDRVTAEEKTKQLEEKFPPSDVVLKQKEEALVDLKVHFAQCRERQAAIDREGEQLVSLKSETTVGISRLVGDIATGNDTIATLLRDTETLKGERGVLVRSLEKLEGAQHTLKEQYDREVVVLGEQELSIRELRREHDEAVRAAHEIALKVSEQRGKVHYLEQGIRERYHLELSQLDEQYVGDDDSFDLDAESTEVEALRARLEQMGSVNSDAIKEYEELSERHQFLNKQHEDLTASLEALSRAITKINRTSRKRFRDTFDAVDAEFQTLFPKLFRGGKARLLLTDEENLLESGVEIIASPPGKKLQSITLLSGGEKALTAVALIFSIFLIKPSPFCLLDEVDAPLDDANIDRFNDLIRSMTPHSQFILITHNKRTMELADLLYGITMEEPGVSKMVSVKLGQETVLPQPAVA